MNLHREHHFESEICAHLAAHGWLHAEGDAAQFDRAHGQLLPDLLGSVEATQPESWLRPSKTLRVAVERVHLSVPPAAAMWHPGT